MLAVIPRWTKWGLRIAPVILPFLGCVAIASPQQNSPQVPPEIKLLAQQTAKNIAKLHVPGILLTQLPGCFGRPQLCDQLDTALHDELVAQIPGARFVPRDEAAKYLEKHGFLAIDGYLGALDDVAGDAGADVVISETAVWKGTFCRLEAKVRATKRSKSIGTFTRTVDCADAPNDRFVFLKDSNTGVAIAVPNAQGSLILHAQNYPKCIKCLPPNYSPDLLLRRAEGVVHLLVTVTTDGKLEDAAVCGPADPEMARLSLITMVNWRVASATDQDGKTFPSRIAVEVNFKMR